MKDSPVLRLQRRWQFQVGVALLVSPTLLGVAYYTYIFQAAMGEKGVDDAVIQKGVETALTISWWCLPLHLAGFIFIAVAIYRGLR